MTKEIEYVWDEELMEPVPVKNNLVITTNRFLNGKQDCRKFMQKIRGRFDLIQILPLIFYI